MIGTIRRRLEEPTIAELLGEARRWAGLTQGQLAAMVGTTQSAISRWERGHDTPRADTLATLLRACGYEVDVVLRPIDTGVDRAQIRGTLRMTPDQRLEQVKNMHEFVRTARRAS